MFCKKCGNEVKPGAKFCVKCGTQVGETLMNEKKLEKEPEKKKKFPIVLIIILVVMLLFVGGATAGLILYKNVLNSQNSQEGQQIENEDSGEEDLAEKQEKKEETSSEKEKTSKTKDKEETSEPNKSKEVKAVAEGATDKAEVQKEDSKEIIEKTEATVTVAPVEHTYQIIVADVSWTEAYNAAREIPNGYLVNIDTEEEYNKIIAQINEQGYGECIFWIGAMRRKSSNEYHWVDKDGLLKEESLNGSSHWLINEPSFYDYEFEKDEQYVDMFFHKKTNSWVWNDVPDDLVSLLSYYSGKMAYIVEIENQ